MRPQQLVDLLPVARPSSRATTRLRTISTSDGNSLIPKRRTTSIRRSPSTSTTRSRAFWLTLTQATSLSIRRDGPERR